MSRFARTGRLLGPEGLARLAHARVLVAGLGAVGSYAVEGLARAGVGRLRLVDFDRIRPSNLNRQLYALESTLGLLKTDAAAARVRDIHPGCVIESDPLFIDRDTAAELCAEPYDAVVDAIDSLGPKVALLEAAARRGLFVVSAMGAATRTDPAAVRVGDLSDTDACPLARLVRKRLRARGIVTGIRCVYSLEPARPPRTDAPAEPAEPEEPARGRTRTPLGSLSTLTGIFGLIAATEVLRHLAGDAWPGDART
jgi:tRNA threonylcarbamoyladenosine dehydratase